MIFRFFNKKCTARFDYDYHEIAYIFIMNIHVYTLPIMNNGEKCLALSSD